MIRSNYSISLQRVNGDLIKLCPIELVAPNGRCFSHFCLPRGNEFVGAATPMLPVKETPRISLFKEEQTGGF